MKKLTKALVKRTSKFIEDLESLRCQKYSDGKCRDFSTLNPELCPACQIREGAAIIRKAVDRYNPHQIVF